LSDSEGSSPKIKVVDRRWFTDDGDPRPDRPVTAQAAARASAPPPPAAAANATAPATSREFVELVAMLAQQAELMLIGAEGLPPHPDEARHLIDCLGALEAKTRGNLSLEESRILTNVLYQLRSSFVQGQR